MKVFLDTMVYLHYKSIDELNLTEFLGSSSYTIILPRITLRELDKHKNTHNSDRIRNRARKLLKKIERWSQGEIVRPGVQMEFFSSKAIVDFDKHGLNRDWPDDILIAAVLQYNLDHPEEDDATLVTQDSGPRITASQLGIRVLELPDKYKLMDEPNPLEAKNRDLLQTISLLQNALPKLAVNFSGSEEPKQYETFSLKHQPGLVEEEIKQKIEELRSEYPEQHPPDLSPTASPLLSQLLTQLPDHRYNSIPPEEYERYNVAVKEYLKKYERYMRDKWEQRTAMLRTIQFSIEIRNMGTAPAEDVDVLFHFPDGIILFLEDDIPSVPQEPHPPQKPRKSIQIMTEHIGRIPHFDPGRPAVSDFKMPTSFRIERTQSYDVLDHFSRIKHGDYVETPMLFLMFGSYEGASSFECEYTIRPANMPSPSTGKLHFVIKKEDANNANHGD